MTNAGRSRAAARRSTRSGGQMIVAALLAVAVVASLFLVFTDSVQLLRVGVVVAAWGTVFGAIALTKYRRESALDKAKAADLQTVYELQLEREITARREYELAVEHRVRAEVGADAEEMAALRAELAALRKNLEQLFDGAIHTERIALRADSTRVQEISGGPYSSYQPAASGLYIPGSTNSGTERPPGPMLASPDDAPVTAETAIITAEVREEYETRRPAPSAARDASAGRPGPEPESDAERTDPRGSVPQFSASGLPDAENAQASARPTYHPVPAPEPAAYVAPEPEPALEHEPEPAFQSTPEPAFQSTPEPEPEPIPETEDPPRRRRRAAPDDDETPTGAHSSGLTVAEIIANMRSSDDEPGPEVGTGRRRRRAE